MCKIGLADEALYYYSLLYWDEGGVQSENLKVPILKSETQQLKT